MIDKKIFLCFLTLFASIESLKSYKDFKVYNVIPSSDDQVQILTDLSKEGFEFWNDVILVDSAVNIMVSPEKNAEFLNYSDTVGLKPELSIPNVQELIDAQRRPRNARSSVSLGSFNWDNYHNLSVIHNWLDELQELYPDIVTTINIGISNEGRNLKAVIIDFKAGERDIPLIGMIEGGIHAREWISPATVTWIIKEFLTSNDPEVRNLAEAFVWHILPVANPDGYVYTFSNDRMWRKNRNPANFVNCPTSDDDLSNGIDLNRNFDFLWMETGASSNPCSQTYAGPNPASEPETRAIANYVQQLKQDGNMIYYFAFHSYSQMILIPYSHASGYDVLQAENYPDLYEISVRGAEKLSERHGVQYTVGTSAEILYEVSGSSFDWVKGVADIPIVYLFELRDVGRYGFLLPADEIIPNNEEIMDCLLEMDKTTRKLGYYTFSGSQTVFASTVSIVMSIGLLIVAY